MAAAIKKVVILGGGTAGWMTAAALSHHLNASKTQITLIESEEIGTIGVGEATIPHLKLFNQSIGIDEQEFMRETQATFKLGIRFDDWGQKNQQYMHPFGGHGYASNKIDFYHYWLQSRAASLDNKQRPLTHYSFANVAAEQNKFCLPHSDHNHIASTFGYAYHIDASLYAKFLRKRAEKQGLKRIEGKVSRVQQHVNQHIKSITLENGQTIDGDLFIDCSGFRGLLIEKTLNTGYDNWRKWLPCDSAVAVACEKQTTTRPYSIAKAQEAGWQWRIPLQSRTGNGYVFSSQYCDTETAKKTLLSNLDNPSLHEPIQLRFTTGKRKKVWHKNCVAIGLSSGFLEPLESTGLHLIQEAIMTLLTHFPNMEFDSHLATEFNQHLNNEYQAIRDFLVLHYHATQRSDSAFWRHCKNMTIPDTLAERIELFKTTGVIAKHRANVFAQPSWEAVYFGQNILPQQSHALVRHYNSLELKRHLNELQTQIKANVDLMPTHDEFLDQYLAVNPAPETNLEQ
ncbi:tryptophan halogenase family protein [Algibacillus agarilyticus]|uniref:tryptophan halogenase family protein n=1 Tax=Algibacillus agarilyticus TaxID=2234133 RepID=UPI000DD044D5|nr:tryptophan halogenase family protein [Algibacillus agarilyticus]